MNPILGIPRAAQPTLADPPLKAILGQVRFPSITSVDFEEGAPLETRLKTDYPLLTTERQIGVGLDDSGAPRKAESQQWRHSSEDGVWSVVLGRDFVSLEVSSPRQIRYRDFRARFRDAWGGALHELRPTCRLQLGLRYINHLTADVDYDWTRSINRELLGFLAAPERQAALEVAVNNWVFSVPHGLLAMKHGVVRAGERDELGYLLDFDCVTQQNRELLDVESDLATLDEFHEAIVTLFCWSVTDEAMGAFGRV